MRNREVIGRQLTLLRLLEEQRSGLSSVSLASALGVSRQTVDRDLALLRDRVRIDIAKRRTPDGVRHVLRGAPVSLVLTPAERAALALARAALTDLEGTEPLAALDSLGKGPAPQYTTKIVAATTGPRAEVVRQIDLAIVRTKRLEIVVAVAKRRGALSTYELDPLQLRRSAGTLYLDAWSHAARAVRTFKVERIRRATILATRADEHGDIDLDALFATSLKGWSGEETPVRIRLAPEVAWCVGEYPLSRDQTVTQEQDGSVIVSAVVSGYVEISRWTLSWGRHAAVLHPPALREQLAAELREAAASYQSEELRPRKVSDSPAGSPAPPLAEGQAQRERPGFAGADCE